MVDELGKRGVVLMMGIGAEKKGFWYFYYWKILYFSMFALSIRLKIYKKSNNYYYHCYHHNQTNKFD